MEDKDKTILVEKLLSGSVSTLKLTEMRSNARRYNNLPLSIALSEVYEIYKYRRKHEKERET